MDFRDIRALVKTGENEHVEFKRKASFPEKIVKEVIAFANTSGGYLLIGVDDDRTIPGLKYVEEEAYALETAIQKYCFPKIRYRSEVIGITDKKSVILYTIFESRKKPHFVKNVEGRTGKKSYIRIHDKSIQASHEIIEILKRSRRRNGVKFSFGEKEKLLMQYLDKKAGITMNEFAKIAGLTRTVASQTLVWLVLANVLKVVPGEEQDIYIRKEESEETSLKNIFF